VSHGGGRRGDSITMRGEDNEEGEEGEGE